MRLGYASVLGVAALALAFAFLALRDQPPPDLDSNHAPDFGETVRAKNDRPSPPTQNSGRVEAALIAPPTASPTSSEPPLESKRQAARLYQGGRVRPVYDLTSNAVEGVRVLDVQPDSFWAELGIQSGDLILELDGEPINTPAATVRLMDSVSKGEILTLRVQRTDNQVQFIEYRDPK